MKTFVIATLLTITAMSLFTGCEKPDYQDPRYRSSKTK